MSLHARLRHSMGDRLLEIPARPVDRPFVLGRGSDSDLVVPSVSVAMRQCALYVYEGQWAVEELTPGGTQLNNCPLDGPTLLSTGDVLTLGGDAIATTLEIDPGGAAAGRGGSPALDVTQRRGAQSARPAGRSRPQVASVPGVSFVGPVASPPQPTWPPASDPAPIEPAYGTENEGDRGDADWSAALADPTPRRPSRRRKAAPSSTPMIIAIVLGVVIVGVTAWVVVEEMQPPPVVVTPPPPPPPPRRHVPTSIFDDQDSAPPAAQSPNADGDQSGSGAAKPDPAAGDNSDK